MDFPNSDNQRSKTCVFATWSDWDLGVCFQKECRRKQIPVARIFKKWIDIRALFKAYFSQPYLGLSGALSYLGMTFEGKQHCGLHDARNTARLVGKMIEEGVVLKLTRK